MVIAYWYKKKATNFILQISRLKVLGRKWYIEDRQGRFDICITGDNYRKKQGKRMK